RAGAAGRRPPPGGCSRRAAPPSAPPWRASMAADGLADLLALRAVVPRRIVGLISGTSADGIDAALVEVEGAGETTAVRLVEFASRPYDAALRARVLAAKDAEAAE